MMFTVSTRPNRLTSSKNDDYHLKYAQYILTSMNSSVYRNFIKKSLINWAFYKGKQWILEDDLEAFFLDEDGDYRNRLKWTKNIIRPMVNQYVGNSIRMSYDARAKCVSEFVVTKKEQDLQKMLSFQKIGESFPFAKSVIKDRLPIGETELETRELFETNFTDEFSDAINNLVEVVSEEIKINELKVQITRNLATTGLGIYKGSEVNGKYKGEAINPLFFIYDTSALKPDLSDSTFMGEWYFKDLSSILEEYPDVSTDCAKSMEEFSTRELTSYYRVINDVEVNQSGKIPVYEVYWIDVEKAEFGYVKDESGIELFTRINHDSCIYTDKDLIKPESEKSQERVGKNLKATRYLDVIRYCIFVPMEQMGTGKDIILDYGEMPYQDKSYNDPASVKWPYKCYTWAYDRGEVISPIDDVIDPQRFLNRVLSVTESHFSNMRGTGTVISKDAIDDNEEETRRNINQSKPITVDTSRTGSVQNSVGTYGNNIGTDTYNMFQAIREIQTGIQDVTGVNESMTGTQGGGDMLVGVVEAQIQRGSLVQEPFYWALTSILNEAYNHIANVGKNIYYDNYNKLIAMVGEPGAKIIELTKDHVTQDYRVFIKRSESRESAIDRGNTLLITLRQSNMIDDDLFSKLFNRSDADKIAQALRKYSLLKKQSENKAMEEEAALQQAESNQAQNIINSQNNSMIESAAIEQENKLLDHELELERIEAKKM